MVMKVPKPAMTSVPAVVPASSTRKNLVTTVQVLSRRSAQNIIKQKSDGDEKFLHLTVRNFQSGIDVRITI